MLVVLRVPLHLQQVLQVRPLQGSLACLLLHRVHPVLRLLRGVPQLHRGVHQLHRVLRLFRGVHQLHRVLQQAALVTSSSVLAWLRLQVLQVLLRQVALVGPPGQFLPE